MNKINYKSKKFTEHDRYSKKNAYPKINKICHKGDTVINIVSTQCFHVIFLLDTLSTKRKVTRIKENIRNVLFYGFSCRR